MSWLLGLPNTLSKFSELGVMQDQTYIVDEAAALVVLEEMLIKLRSEDQTLRSYRRSIGFGQYIQKNLIPLMIFAKNDQVIDATIQLMVNLTLPIECLYSVDLMSRTEAGRLNITEICSLLTVNKNCFTDLRVIRAIVEHLRAVLEKDPRLSQEQCISINSCLLLLRNVLHIPETNGSGDKMTNGTLGTAVQNQILWNLFAMSIDKLLIHLMSCPQRGFFGVALVQLIALMYKDQHINTLQKLLNMWFEASVSDSSEDFESNTTPPKQNSGDSSPMLTSDSSDDGGQIKGATKECSANSPATTQSCVTTKCSNSQFWSTVNPSLASSNLPVQTSSTMSIELDSGSCKNSDYSSSTEQRKKSVISEVSDCGYGTQVENPEIISTSSNEDDMPMGHQKPPLTNQKQRYNAVNNPRSAITIHDKKEWRRKKLVKRSKTSLINMKGLLHHTPSDEAISSILKEFTVDFLLKGYSFLVKDLHFQLLQQSEFTIEIDTSHFFWLITYFLKFTAQLESDLEHVKGVLSYEIISYLTYEGVNLIEELDILTSQDGLDKKSCLRRLHLVVTSIKEFLQVMDAYKKISHLSVDDRAHLHLLTLQVSASSELHCLFVLLLRRYNPSINSKQYLQDIVVTNHILLILLDEASKLTDYTGNFKMLEHIEQYATVEVMHKYGLLLADFQQNGEFVNDCIFTMMHHIGGDVGQVAALFQPIILKTFSNIFETEYELCDDWSDLIEYIMHKFINAPQKTSLSLPCNMLTDIDVNDSDKICDTWTKAEINTLYWYYVQCKKSKDMIAGVNELYRSNGLKPKSRIAVIQQLLHQDIIARMEYDSLMKSENIETEYDMKSSYSLSSHDESGIFMRKSSTVMDKVSDDIEFLTEKLKSEGKGKSLVWLQKTLLDCCFVKFSLKSQNPLAIDQNIMEPVPLYHYLKHKSVPLVPWNAEQSQILQYQPFMLLMHKLGFHLPADSGRIFTRIPEFWTPEILYNIAIKLGAVDHSLLRFNLNELTIHDHDVNEIVTRNPLLEYGMNKHNCRISFTPDPIPEYTPNWLGIVSNSKTAEFQSSYCTPNPPQYLLTTKTTFYSTDSIGDEAAASIKELCVSEKNDRNNNDNNTKNHNTKNNNPNTNDNNNIMNSNNYNNNITNNNNQINYNNTYSHYASKIDRLPDVEEILDEDNAIDDDHNDTCYCDTVSVASDLTQIYDLYVSDEEDT